MLDRAYIIAIFDFLFVTCILLMVTISAIELRKSKGVADLDYINLFPTVQYNNISGTTDNFDFYAIIIEDNNKLELLHYKKGKVSSIIADCNIDLFFEQLETQIDHTADYVLYEKHHNSIFGETIKRFMLHHQKTIGIGKIKSQ